MKGCSLVVVGLGLLVGCRAEEARPPLSGDAGAREWRIHFAEPEAGEDEPPTVLLTRRADAEVGAETARPRLVIGCEEAETKVYVEWGMPLGAGTAPVAMRLDDGSEQTLPWAISDDGEAAGLWHDQASVPFLRTLLGHDRLAASVRPDGQPVLTATFTLSGLDTLITRVQRECGWGEPAGP